MINDPSNLRDPRLYQVAVLGSLLVYGIGWLDFEVRFAQAAVTLVTVVLTQYFCTFIWKLPVYDPRSALISGLSLCLLLRANALAPTVAAAVVTILSKFVVRWRGKHLFNPTNFGLVVMMLITDQVWVSPGQWGSGAIFAFLLACLGGLVVNRASRSDVTCAFLVSHALLLFGRSCWLGEPMSIPLHRMQNGALLLFSFFMISDPKTTPNSRAGRILFGLFVALGAAYVQFVLFRTNGLLWSLGACAPFVPVFDRFLPGARYQWTGSKPTVQDLRKGESYETVDEVGVGPSEPGSVLPHRP